MAEPEYRTPFLPFYFEDWFGSRQVAQLSGDGEALFLRLLAWQWSTGPLPDTLDGVLALVPFRRGYEAAWPAVRKLFKEAGPGHMENARLEEIRADWAAKRDQRLGAARASVEARRKRNPNGEANGDGYGAANGNPNGEANETPPLPASGFRLPSSSLPASGNPPAAAPPAPAGGARPPRRLKAKEKPAVSPECRRVLAFIEWWKYGPEGGPQLSAPGLIPDRLAEGYTVHDCMLAFWRTVRRWKEGHNQVSPFRPAHFGVLLDEARTDLAKGWDNPSGRRNPGFDAVFDSLKAKGLGEEELTAALAKRDWTRQGQLLTFTHFAEHGAWPPEEKS